MSGKAGDFVDSVCDLLNNLLLYIVNTVDRNGDAVQQDEFN